MTFSQSPAWRMADERARALERVFGAETNRHQRMPHLEAVLTVGNIDILDGHPIRSG